MAALHETPQSIRPTYAHALLAGPSRDLSQVWATRPRGDHGACPRVASWCSRDTPAVSGPESDPFLAQVVGTVHRSKRSTIPRSPSLCAHENRTVHLATTKPRTRSTARDNELEDDRGRRSVAASADVATCPKRVTPRRIAPPFAALRSRWRTRRACAGRAAYDAPSVDTGRQGRPPSLHHDHRPLSGPHR